MSEDDELVNVLVFKFYMPEYDFQSKPFIVPMRCGMTLREATNDAKLRFLKYGIKPIGKIHRKHAEMMRDGRITYDVRSTTMARHDIKYGLGIPRAPWKRAGRRPPLKRPTRKKAARRPRLRRPAWRKPIWRKPKWKTARRAR